MISEKNHTDWVELVLFLSDLLYLDEKRLKRYSQYFNRVTVAGPGERPERLPDHVEWYSYREEETRTDIWNHLLDVSEREWVLFLEDDEEARLYDLPDESEVCKEQWFPALILQTDRSGGCHYYYQMRLVTRIDKPLFDGKNLPDCTRVLTRQNIGLSQPVIRIDRTSTPYSHVNPDQELSVQHFSPQVFLMQGKRLSDEGKYVHAAAQYRRLLKREKVMPFDRLGAVNGMAQCYTEQYKWEKAISLARQSIKAEPQQRIPWLILFRIYQLRKQWNEACEALKSYHKVLPFESMAGFDKKIDERESMAWLADMALQAGMKREALNRFEQLADMKKGEGRPLYRQLLNLSVELKEEGRATHYFHCLYEARIEQLETADSGNALKLADSEKAELHEMMASFMSNGWYDFVSEVYTRLYQIDPGNLEFRRRLIASLMKKGELGRARKLV